MELNKSQYKNLLMVTYCGEWVINAHKEEEDKTQIETENLQQYIYSFAKEKGFENLIEYDEDLKLYFPTMEMEELFHGFIDDFENNIKNDFD